MTIRNEIQRVSEVIDGNFTRLNKESVWLMTATLGVWGVTFKPMQLIAFLIVALMFFQRASGRNFSKSITEIDRKIDMIGSSTTEGRMLGREFGLVKRKLQFGNAMKRAWTYVFGLTFLIGSIWYCIALS